MSWSYLSIPATAQPPTPQAPAAEGSQQHWEMVIPTMSRPSSRLPGPVSPQPLPAPAPPLRAVSRGSFWSTLPASAKIGGATVLALAAAAAIYPWNSPPPRANQIQIASALPAGPSDWIREFSLLPAGPERTREVSLIRGSVNLADFRLDFRGLIQEKALACAFRARDPNNFYVLKVLVVRPSADPLVALERFAVIDGADEPHAQIPLPMQTYLDTPYRVRLEAVGNRFTAWVQDVKVDEWTDARLPAGGVGISREPGERWTLQGEMSLRPLSAKI